MNQNVPIEMKIGNSHLKGGVGLQDQKVNPIIQRTHNFLSDFQYRFPFHSTIVTPSV